MKRASSATFVLTLALALSSSSADAAYVSRPDATASFTAIGPAGLNIVGTTHDLALREDAQGQISVTVNLSTLRTGISLRDKHMREKYLQVDKYPTAVLHVPRATLKLPSGAGSGSFDGEGRLTLHGTTKPVVFHYVAKGNGNRTFGVTGTMRVNMNDFGIETPRYLGISVKPGVDLSVTFTADDKS